MNNNDEHRYDHMLNMPHHQSAKRKHMTMIERAAQFGAFRALTGHEDAIAETARLTDARLELDEYQKADVDMKLHFIGENIEDAPEIAVTYFVPDDKKQGGAYITHIGEVKKIREYEKDIVFVDGTEIPIDDVFDINGKILGLINND